MRPYFIVCYPRSRAAWLANALTYGPSACAFEGSIGCYGLDDLDRRLEGLGAEFSGNSDSVNALLLDRIVQRWPTAPILVIERPLAEVEAGLARLGVIISDGVMARVRAGMRLAKTLPQALVVPFSEIGSGGEAIWRHCVPGQPFNANRWKMLEDFNVQVRNDVEAAKALNNSQAMRQLLGDCQT